MSRTRHLPRAARFGAPLMILGLVAGCSGSGAGGGASSAAGPGVAAAPERAAGAGSAGDASAGTSSEGSTAVQKATSGYADPLPSGTRRVRTAEATIQVDDVRAAAARVRTDATALGGLVSTEQISFGGGTSTMTVRVPEPALDRAMDSFAAVGAERSRSMSSDDVTAAVADLNSRVATQEASVKRVRQLLDRAQKLGDVVLLEGELTRREGDLEAAQARYRTLDDEATLATATLTLVTVTAATPVRHQDGFRSGFAAGWAAVRASTAVLLTGLGAVFPFAIVLAVLGVPVLAWRRRARPAQAESAQAESAQPDPPQPDPAPAPDAQTSP